MLGVLLPRRQPPDDSGGRSYLTRVRGFTQEVRTVNSLLLNAIIVEARRLSVLSVHHREQSNFESGLLVAAQLKFLAEKAGHLQNEVDRITSSLP